MNTAFADALLKHMAATNDEQLRELCRQQFVEIYSGESNAAKKRTREEAEAAAVHNPPAPEPKLIAPIDDEQEQEFVKGEMLYALTDERENFPLYWKTYHRVNYVGPSKDKPGDHVCKMQAFSNFEPWTGTADLLHRSSESAKFHSFDEIKVGMTVRVLIKNRRGVNECGKRVLLDGKRASLGVWVQAKVISTQNTEERYVNLQIPVWNFKEKSTGTTTQVFPFTFGTIRPLFPGDKILDE
jgi:hypothetical protein